MNISRRSVVTGPFAAPSHGNFRRKLSFVDNQARCWLPVRRSVGRRGPTDGRASQRPANLDVKVIGDAFEAIANREEFAFQIEISRAVPYATPRPNTSNAAWRRTPSVGISVPGTSICHRNAD